MTHGCTLTPIPIGPHATDNRNMVELAIRCHPCVPVSPDELEVWLERQLVELRNTAPRGIVRLSRLTQERPSTTIDIGWLIELELHPSEAPLTRERLGETLRDMRLLGLQPQVLAPLATTESPIASRANGAHA